MPYPHDEANRVDGAVAATADSTVPNYLTPAVVLTIFGCVPLGMVALFYSSQVNTRNGLGDLAGAEECSKLARRWCWIAAAAGAVVWGLALLGVSLALGMGVKG